MSTSNENCDASTKSDAYEPGVMPASTLSMDSKKKHFKGLSSKYKNQQSNVLNKSSQLLIKFQKPYIKKILISSYITILLLSILNTSLCNSTELDWKTAGGPSFLACILTTVGFMLVIFYYKFKAEDNLGVKHPELPYILTRCTLDKPFGLLEFGAHGLIFFVWTAVGASEIQLLTMVGSEDQGNKKFALTMALLTYLGIASLLAPIIAIRAVENYIILSKIKGEDPDDIDS